MTACCVPIAGYEKDFGNKKNISDSRQAMSVKKTNFFFVGVGKCGTSWIYERLGEHPEVCLGAIKEPYIVCENPQKMQSSYDKHFKGGGERCDLSTLYYENPENAAEIYNYNRNAKIILTVRTPSKRIASHFKYMQRHGMHVDLTLDEYLNLKGDPENVVGRCNYHVFEKRYISKFGRRNVLVLPLESLSKDAQNYYNRLTDFMGIAKVQLTEQEKAPVRVQSVARSVLAAKTAKFVADTLRGLGWLEVLGWLKGVSVIQRMLYREDPNKDSQVFAAMEARSVRALDGEYEKRYGRLYK